jgi:hypothetical protein
VCPGAARAFHGTLWASMTVPAAAGRCRGSEHVQEVPGGVLSMQGEERGSGVF